MAQFTIEGDKLTPHEQTCWHCEGTGQVLELHKCTACRGKGHLPNKRKPCPTCNGKQYLPDDAPKQCYTCKGSGQYTPDRYCAVMKADHVLEQLRYKVIRSNRAQSINEYLLGYGCLTSVTDYGAYKRFTSDDDLIEFVKHDLDYVQAVAFTDESWAIAPMIGIYCNDQGYSVRPMWSTPEEEQRKVNTELPTETGIAFGQAVANMGGNGTMAACLYHE